MAVDRASVDRRQCLGRQFEWLALRAWGMLTVVDIRVQHRDVVKLAERIVQRAQAGRLDIAAELIMRALATSDADGTFALALALTEQALNAVEDSRVDAAANEMPWQPAYRLSSGHLVTPAHEAIEPMPLAMRMVSALHRGMGGDKEAIAELGQIYERAASADDATFHGMFAALATYAAQGRRDNVEVLAEPASAVV
jgi:hypothetical protein